MYHGVFQSRNESCGDEIVWVVNSAITNCWFRLVVSFPYRNPLLVGFCLLQNTQKKKQQPLTKHWGAGLLNDKYDWNQTKLCCQSFALEIFPFPQLPSEQYCDWNCNSASLMWTWHKNSSQLLVENKQQKPQKLCPYLWVFKVHWFLNFENLVNLVRKCPISESLGFDGDLRIASSGQCAKTR